MRARTALLSSIVLPLALLSPGPSGHAHARSPSFAPPPPGATERTYTPAELAEDFAVLRRSLTQLHPGLYRYNSPAQLERKFDELEARLKKPTADGALFRLLAEFAAGVKCGHTYLNPLNQPKAVRARFFEGRTYLPFHFRLVGRRMIVTGNLTPQKLTAGSEITRINGVAASRIVRELLKVTTADGANTDAARLKSLELRVTRENVHQVFDIYYPLYFPLAADGLYRVEAVERATGKQVRFEVPAMTRAERFAETARRYGPPPTYEDDWRFEMVADGVAYLKVPHSLTWRLKQIDYRKFIADAFAAARAKKVGALIIDWRGNDGGDTAVGRLVASYLAARPVECYDRRTRFVKSLKVDEDLFRHMVFYDEELKAGLLKGLPPTRFAPDGNGLVRAVGDPPCQGLEPQPDAFRGRAFVIADATNASASFQFLRAVRENRLAAIVGQPSAGNLQGISGGSYALLTLPRSRVEIDIPLYFQAPPTPQPDAPILPDYVVEPNAADIAAGVDTELSYVLKIARHSTTVEEGASDEQ